MRRVPFRWTDLALMIAGGVIAVVLYILLTGDADAEGPYVGTAVLVGVSLGTYPLVMRIHRQEQAKEAAEAAPAVEPETGSEA